MGNFQYSHSVSGNPFGTMFSSAEVSGVIMLICAAIAVIASIVISFTFLSKKHEGKYNGFLGWLYETLSFKKLLSETLFKIAYLIMALWVTLSAFASLIFGHYVNFGARIVAFLITILFGNLFVRLVYEFSLVILIICRNTTEINNKMSNGLSQLNINRGTNNQQGPQELEEPYLQQGNKDAANQQVGVVFCRNCGNQFYSNEAKCPHCGSNR